MTHVFDDGPRPGPSGSQTEVEETKNNCKEKLLNTSFSEIEDSYGSITRSISLALAKRTESICRAKGLKILDIELLETSLQAAFVCRNCENKDAKIQVMVSDDRREGLAENLMITCRHCGFQTPVPTSKHTAGSKGRGTLEVNLRSVHSSYQWGHAGLEKFCGGMGLPPPLSSRAYNEQVKKIAHHAVKITEKIMLESAERLIKVVEREDQTKIEVIEGGKKVAKVAVTVDGTWQKRGHSSRIGVVFVIAVRTGEVLDYSLKSLSCHECQSHEHDHKDSDQYKKWLQKHRDYCHINHEGSSGSIEVAGANKIFTRSIETRALKYTEFIGDGDGSTFGKVKEALEIKYGDHYSIIKEECVGHVQKRIGASLREYKRKMKSEKLSDGKPVGGKGRLTKVAIDSMQNYYGLAIRKNQGNLEGMKKSIMAIQHHMIKSNTKSLEQQHQYCPQDELTWCKFWREKLFKDGKYSEENRLPAIFHDELSPIFDRLSKDELLNRCLRGITQNQNESLNSQLWTNQCPKTKYCGLQRVTIAVCESAAVFNTGAAFKALLMQSLGIQELGSKSFTSLRMEDRRRTENVTKKTSTKVKVNRKDLRIKKKRKAGNSCDTFYKSGAFGLEAEPEVGDGAEKYQNRKRNRPEAEPVEVQNITFCDEKDTILTIDSKRKK